MKEFDVIDIGVIVGDLPVKVPENKIDFTDDSISLNYKIEIIAGGDAANSAKIMSRLGVKTVLLGCVGDDGIGKSVLKDIEECGVCVSHVKKRKDLKTALSVVLINDKGDRTFISGPGHNSEFCEEDIDTSLFKKAKHINYSSYFSHPLIEKDKLGKIFENAKNEGLTISADVRNDKYGLGADNVIDSLKYVDIFMPSYVEAKYITGEIDPEKQKDVIINKAGNKKVVIKLGEEGSYIWDGKKSKIVPSYKINPIDTTGAGDNYVAAFVSRFLEGYDMESCAAFANAAGALCCMKIGAADKNIAKEIIIDFMKNNNLNEI